MLLKSAYLCMYSLFNLHFPLQFVQRKQECSTTHLMKLFYVYWFICTGRALSHTVSSDLGNIFDLVQLNANISANLPF